MVCCDSELECEICGKRFSSKSSRLTHQRSHRLIIDPSCTLPEARPVGRPKGLKLKLRSRNKELLVKKLVQETKDPNCHGVVNVSEVKKCTSSPLLQSDNTTEEAVSSQNINIFYDTVNNIIINKSPADKRELENVCKKEKVHYNRRYDIGCSFLRAFEHEQKLNTHNPVDFLFNKVGFKSASIKDERNCSVKFLFHKKKNTTSEVKDSSKPIIMSSQHILPHNDNQEEEQKVKIECDQDLTPLPELDIVFNPYLPVKESDKCEVKVENLPELNISVKDEDILPELDTAINPYASVKESDIFDVKDEEVLGWSESEEPNKNEDCVKENKLSEDDSMSKILKKETIELEISEKEDNPFTNAKKLWINDFDKENIPKPAISNETVSLPLNVENSDLKQSTLLHNDGQRNKVPVLVIKKSGSSENSSEEWLVSKEKSATVEEENLDKTIELKTKITQSFMPEKNVITVDSSNSNLTLKFKRVEKPLSSSEYKVVNSKHGDERNLSSLKVTEKCKSDLESRHEPPSLTRKMPEKEIISKREKPTNVVPPLILFKKENTVIETFTSKKRIKHSSETAEKTLGEEPSKSDDFENLSMKIYPKVSYKPKRLKCSHSPIELPHSDFRTTKNENSFELSKSSNDRLQLQGHNKSLLIHRSPSFSFAQNSLAQSIDMSSPSSFKLVLSNISKSVPSSSSASSSLIQEPICNADDENVTVQDLDLHSNVSFGRLSFNDAACMPSGVNFNDTACLPSKVNFNDAAFVSSSEVLNFSKKNFKKS